MATPARQLKATRSAAPGKPVRRRRAAHHPHPAWPQRWVLRLTDQGGVWYYRGLSKFSDDANHAIEFSTFLCAVEIADELRRRLPVKKRALLETVKARLLPGRANNPVPPSAKARLKAAMALYEEFTGHPPDNIDRVSVPPVDTALAIGDCHAVIYGCVRDGKHEQYIHEFKKKARPLLASSFDGQSLILLGGGFQFTDRGITDL